MKRGVGPVGCLTRRVSDTDYTVIIAFQFKNAFLFIDFKVCNKNRNFNAIIIILMRFLPDIKHYSNVIFAKRINRMEWRAAVTSVGKTYTLR